MVNSTNQDQKETSLMRNRQTTISQTNVIPKLCFKVQKKARIPAVIAVHLYYPGGFGQSKKKGKRRRRKRYKYQKGRETVLFVNGNFSVNSHQFRIRTNKISKIFSEIWLERRHSVQTSSNQFENLIEKNSYLDSIKNVNILEELKNVHHSYMKETNFNRRTSK